jgi:GTP-binding protein HflX
MVEKSYQHYTLDEWKKTWMQRQGDNVLFISATEKENIEEFRKKVYDTVRDIHITRFPYNNFLYPEYDAYTGDEELED